MIAFVLATALGLPATAEMLCTAQTQCRGDAKEMCAPSTLAVKVVRDGAYWRLWIDWQGPYSARFSAGNDARVWAVKGFGNGYGIQVFEDGSFLYTGNRGKRFRGTCTGEV
ncbi:hypothetical protein [Pacificoceanicola onchidii]|uniref:hypothetical protein n=1 Tax=Pacificoceanicola onchidii TaxID=2562685 RepID=UPI0014560139|nr:hypothetical protein [Pacificoceanicola onchidii]